MKSFRTAGRTRIATSFPVVALALAPGWPGAAGAEPKPGADDRVVRPADEIFWAPTLEQATKMATANRVPILVMGYSLVGDRSTYTKFGDDCASAVF